MDEIEVIPELKQIVGALLFAAKVPMTAGDIRKILRQVAESREDSAKDFAELSEADVRDATIQLGRDLESARAGVHLVEVANGFRLQNDVNCGPWLRQMLDRGKSNRLSKPALETLAIIAYRQPVMRSEIEAVRGVAVDQVLRTLVDMGLVKIVGRSELPGRPWQFGTTQKFLEYFGLKNVQDLPGIAELKRIEAERAAAQAAPPGDSAEPSLPLDESVRADEALEPVEAESGDQSGDVDEEPASEEDAESEPDAAGVDSSEDEDEYDDDDDENDDEYEDEDDDEEDEDDEDDER